MKTEKKLLGLSAELWQAIDADRGDTPRGSYLESILWNSQTIKRSAKAAGVVKPTRPADGRGKWSRKGRK